MKTIVHFVDDQKPGGVQRLLAYLSNHPGMASLAAHEIVPVRRGAWRPPPVEADAIVSHLSVCWRNFPLLVAMRACFSGVPLIHVEHSYSEAFIRHNVKRAERFRSLLKSSYGLFDRIVAVSNGQSLWLEQSDLVPRQKLKTIASCVELSDLLAMAPKHRGSRLALGAVGRLDQQKGFDVLIKAMADVNPNLATLSIWGDGPERNNLTTLADGLPHVDLKGFVADPADAYRQSDAIVVPSRWEPFGLVALEARAAARPILVADVDGLPEQARDGGIVVQTDAGPDLWASAIEEFAALDLGLLRDEARFSADGAESAFSAGWTRLIQDVFSKRFLAGQNAA